MKLAVGVSLLGLVFSPILLAGSLENPFAARPVQVLRQDMARTQVLAAKLLPMWRTDIKAPMDGWIRSVVADVGSRVRKDSALVTLAATGKSGAPPSKPLKVEAPFDGAVLARMVSLGAYVRQGEVLLTLVDDRKMRVHVAMTEKDSLLLREGEKVKVEMEHLPGQAIECPASPLAPWIDPATHLREMECIADNSDHLLVAGMTGRMTVPVEVHANVLVVPRDAIMQQKGEAYVFAIRDGRARKVKITLGLQDLSSAEVREGVAEGDWVLVNPQYAKEGMLVSPK
jgi:multidrug efflux pump subunit AcrA (membrane-fusion protein)